MAKVTYRSIDNEKVSSQWFAVLLDMREDGVQFNVNEGHRTMARQWYFYKNRNKPGFNLAAFPSPIAPHIRTGRIDHAIDFSNDPAVFHWLSTHKLDPVRTVNGESWHIEIPAAVLKRYAELHPAPRVIRKGSHRGVDIKALQVLLRADGYLPAKWHVHTAYTLTVRKAVRKFQKDHHMPVDGVVGPKTLAALRKT